MFHKRDTFPRNDRASQIRDELATLYTELTEFYRNGARATHTKVEIVECEKRRQFIRELYAELDELRKANSVPDESDLPDRIRVQSQRRGNAVRQTYRG
jgi:hypothetical protein